MSSLLEQTRFKAKVSELVSEFNRARSGPFGPGYIGEVDAEQLEHNVRKYFLDKLLVALGWNLSTLNQNIVEEARVSAEKPLFLDYLGVHDVERVPVMIFEAKAWDKPPVNLSRAGAASENRNVRSREASLIAEALDRIKAGDDAASKISEEWTSWLKKMRAYVLGLKARSGHVVPRLAISAGPWLLIFTNVENAFVDDRDVREDLILFINMKDYVVRSGEIFLHLSYQSLVNAVPDFVRPSQALAYVPDASHIRRTHRGLWIKRITVGASFDAHPQIYVYPAVVIERVDRAVVTIVDRAVGRDTIPTDTRLLSDHLNDVQKRSETLFAAVRGYLPGLRSPASLDEFVGFKAAPPRGDDSIIVQSQSEKEFLRLFAGAENEFILCTGAASHYLMESPSVAACRGHDWRECMTLGVEAGSSAIDYPSVDPASFFASGGDHHCAHRTVHDLRHERCHVEPFEGYLCCKACVFQEVCWPAENTTHLPCGLD